MITANATNTPPITLLKTFSLTLLASFAAKRPPITVPIAPKIEAFNGGSVFGV
jgi:hypothetical protein